MIGVKSHFWDKNVLLDIFQTGLAYEYFCDFELDDL